MFPHILKNGIAVLKPGPVYHRFLSCGLGTESFRQQFLQCRNEMNASERKDVNQHITRCYLERLIYEQIYLHLLNFFPQRGNSVPSQDISHTEFLTKIKQDFESCFPLINLSVSVEWDSTILLPVSVKITRKTQNQSAIISEEVYTRLIINPYNISMFSKYDETVLCEKYNDKGEQFKKVQSYTSGENSWFKV